MFIFSRVRLCVDASGRTGADVIARTSPTLCEFVWVLARGYRVPSSDICEAIRRLMNTANVAMNRPAVEMGLALLEAGGDFADGVIAHEGRRLGGEVFLSFDKKATELLEARGACVRLLS
jgi:predicted nucleic-acid-binding protein